MPSLPPVEIQVLRGINGDCRLCGTPVDRRSKVCRRCHLIVVGLHRFPAYRRPRLACRDCGSQISYRSFYGRGRCRDCYHQHRRDNPKPKRSALRDLAGTCYEDHDGNVRYADDQLNENFTAASAWASLRRCWKAVKIAKNNGDEEAVNKYFRLIRYFAKILNLEEPDFSAWSYCG